MSTTPMSSPPSERVKKRASRVPVLASCAALDWLIGGRVRAVEPWEAVASSVIDGEGALCGRPSLLHLDRHDEGALLPASRSRR